MRDSKQISPAKNRSLEEPVYVDEVYPDESIQEEPWSRNNHSPSVNTETKPSLEFEEEEEDELDEEFELDVDEMDDEEEEDETEPPFSPSAVSPPQKSFPSSTTPTPRTYRIKPPRPIVNHPPTQASPQKPLPPELPRPVWRANPQPNRKQREERTGTWPVQPDPKRATPPPKNNHASYPVPTERTNGYTQKEQSPTPQNRSQAPIPWQLPVKPANQPAPNIESTEPQFEPTKNTQVKPSSQQEPLTPPPIFTTTPSSVAPPKGIVTPEPTPARSAYQPLIAPTDSPQEPISDDEFENEVEWELPEQDPIPAGLHDLLERIELPQNSLVLGVCADGLPLVLELSDPSPGALLFLGDDVPGLQKHLQAVLASVCMMSDPKQVQVDIISPTPKSFAAQKMYPHVQKVHQPDQDEMYDLLGSLFELIEDRQRKDNSLAGKLFKDFLPMNKGPVRILMIDQVDVLVEELAPESLAYLRWLLRRGPAANVWVLASLNTRHAQTVEGKTLKAFGLRIHGKIQNAQQATRLTDVPADRLSSLVSGEQACLKLDEELVEFSILE